MAARASTPRGGRGRGSKATKNSKQQRGLRGSKAAVTAPTTAAERRAAADAKWDEQYKKRKAGVALLKSMAVLARERKARREKYEAQSASNTAARAPKPAQARSAGQTAPARAPKPAAADDAPDGNPAGRLLSTLGELAAAKAELFALQQRESLEEAAQRIRDTPGELFKGLTDAGKQ